MKLKEDLLKMLNLLCNRGALNDFHNHLHTFCLLLWEDSSYIAYDFQLKLRQSCTKQVATLVLFNLFPTLTPLGTLGKPVKPTPCSKIRRTQYISYRSCCGDQFSYSVFMEPEMLYTKV